MWSDSAEDSQLSDLRLQTGFHLTAQWLKDLAAKHPRIEHLSITTPCEQITVDSCVNPFEDFANLKSLDLTHGYGENGEPHYGNPQAVGPILDRLRLQSLKISNSVPKALTTPNLNKLLVHLQIDYCLGMKDAERIIFNCRRLESLQFTRFCIRDPYTDDVDRDYPPMIQSHHQMSPHLNSATFALDDVNSNVVR